MAAHTSSSKAPELPTARTNPFDPPEELARLREQEPISPLAYPEGHQGWLVTSYDLARRILADRRFSRRRELQRVPLPFTVSMRPEPAEPGMFLGMDPPEHTRYRRLLTRHFSQRRVSALAPRVAQITTQVVDDVERHGPPVDLVPTFAFPIPSLVICELLGVPYADRAEFQGHTKVLMSLRSNTEQVMSAFVAVRRYLGDLVAAKRAHPADDLLSALARDGSLTDEELTGIAQLLLVAGHETTANMLGIGVYALLRHPDQLAALRAAPELIDDAVEELLRYLTIIHVGPTRAALEDVELDGTLVRAGDVVTLSLPVANRDPALLDDGDRLDVTRPSTSHLTFGHGIHQCLGQQLARLELRTGYAALLDRFPRLRLAVPPEQIRMRTDMVIYGVHNLPVTW
jgi:cytochrome P450